MVTRWEGLGKGIVREFGSDMCTLLYLQWITNKDLLYSTENFAQCKKKKKKKEFLVEWWFSGDGGEVDKGNGSDVGQRI